MTCRFGLDLPPGRAAFSNHEAPQIHRTGQQTSSSLDRGPGTNHRIEIVDLLNVRNTQRTLKVSSTRITDRRATSSNVSRCSRRTVLSSFVAIAVDRWSRPAIRNINNSNSFLETGIWINLTSRASRAPSIKSSIRNLRTLETDFSDSGVSFRAVGGLVGDANALDVNLPVKVVFRWSLGRPVSPLRHCSLLSRLTSVRGDYVVRSGIISTVSIKRGFE